MDRNAVIRGAWFDIRGTGRTNIIIRNLRFEDTFDCFPAWDPTDGSAGNWNAAYDCISIRDAEHVWLDHDDFADVETRDATLPTYFGRLYQVHDGLVDITNAASYLTVSWNRFLDHDKTMLIGASDSATGDRGRLKVTLHHNVFDGVGQRAPRVRFGQVHVYNNYYRVKKTPGYGYSWGVGRESGIYAEQNFFRTDGDVEPAEFLDRFNGTAIVTLATQVDAAAANHAVDVRSEWNAVNDPDLTDAVGWTPELFLSVQPAFKVPALVAARSGPFKW
jgi:pectate lyase